MDEFNEEDILKRAFEGEQIDLKELLQNKLAEHNLSKTKVINMLEIDKDIFNDIINGTAKQPTLVNILKIAQFLEISEKALIDSLVVNMEQGAVAAIEKARKVTFLAKNFDLKTLTKIGFLPNTDDVDIITDRILKFFGYSSIYDFQTNLQVPLYRKSKRNFSDRMKDLWVASAYKCFSEINNPNEYDRELLKDIVSKIKPYSQDVENGLEAVCRALYNAGVTVIFQTHLTTTQIFGATFIISGKPSIVLTDLNKNYPNLWITLLHELEHVLFDFDTIARTVFHITGDPDLFLLEEKAINFSWDYFCDIDKYNFIKIHINNPYIIKKFAEQQEVDESILYWAFMHYQKELNNKNYYGAFGEFFPPYSKAVKNINRITWKEDNYLPEIAKELKNIFELNNTTI